MTVSEHKLLQTSQLNLFVPNQKLYMSLSLPIGILYKIYETDKTRGQLGAVTLTRKLLS